MANIIVPGRQKTNKDCKDWVGAKDGTRTPDPKYCDLSFACRQIGMKSDWIRYKDPSTGEEVHDYFCCGMYADKDNLGEDKEIS